MRTVVIAALASFGLGILVVKGAPPAWGLDPWQGVLLGTALYMGAVHPWLVRRTGSLGALGWRVALFLAIAAGEVYAYYEWLPVADLRAPFAMLSAWVVTESIGVGASRSPASTSVSPRA